MGLTRQATHIAGGVRDPIHTQNVPPRRTWPPTTGRPVCLPPYRSVASGRKRPRGAVFSSGPWEGACCLGVCLGDMSLTQDLVGRGGVGLSVREKLIGGHGLATSRASVLDGPSVADQAEGAGVDPVDEGPVGDVVHQVAPVPRRWLGWPRARPDKAGGHCWTLFWPGTASTGSVEKGLPVGARDSFGGPDRRNSGCDPASTGHRRRTDVEHI